MLPLTLLDLTLLLLVTVAAVVDLAVRRIPNRLLLLAWLTGLTLLSSQPAPGAAVLQGLGAAVIGFSLFLPFYLLGGMAAGDVKLMASVGLLAGPAATVQIAVLAWCAGGAMAVLLLLAKGKGRAGLANLLRLWRPLWLRLCGLPAAAAPLPPSMGTMPYGLAIAVGTLAVLLGRGP